MNNSQKTKRGLLSIARILVLLAFLLSTVLPVLAVNSTITDVNVVPGIFLAGRTGKLSVEARLYVQERFSAMKFELTGSGIAPITRFWFNDNYPVDKIIKADFTLPAQTAGVYGYHLVVTYRPDVQTWVENTLPGDIVYDKGTVNVEWRNQIAPLAMTPGSLPAVIRGYLTNDGFLLREVVQKNGNGDETNIGGVNLSIQAPSGPFEVGVSYPIEVTMNVSYEGNWENDNGWALVHPLVGNGASALHVSYAGDRTSLSNAEMHYRGKSNAQVIIEGVLPFIIPPYHLPEASTLLGSMVKYLMIELDKTLFAANTNLILDHFTPTGEIDYVNHPAYTSIDSEDGRAISMTFGERTADTDSLCEVYEFTLTFDVTFDEYGYHELIFTPDFRIFADWFPNNVYTMRILTAVEYRDDLILRFDVPSPNRSPSLSTPRVLPAATGDTNTSFTFSVVYTDPENDPPSGMNVLVDGVSYILTSTDTTYADGAEFHSTSRTIGTGQHNYSFRATQGGLTINTAPSNFYVSLPAPTHDLQITSTSTNKTSYDPDETVLIRAQIYNPGATAAQNLVVSTQVSGPGGSWSNTHQISSLAAHSYWPAMGQEGVVAQWPGSSVEGEYVIRIDLTCPTCDIDWSNNTTYRGVIISDEGPLAHMYYRYKFFDEQYYNFSPSYRPSGWSGGYFGPLTVNVNGVEIVGYFQPEDHNDGSFWRAHITRNGIVCRDYDDALFDFRRTRYVCAEGGYTEVVVFGVLSFSILSSNPVQWTADIILGSYDTSITLTPTIQNMPLGQTVHFDATIPCSTCIFRDEMVWRATQGDDPPIVFFDQEWDQYYDIDEDAPDISLDITPRIQGVHNFILDTGPEYNGGWSYFIAGKLVGYVPVDNTPAVNIVNPGASQTLSGVVNFDATASDDHSVNRVEFWINGGLVATDTAAPYTYSWNTAVSPDGAYTLLARAYDSVSQMTETSIQVGVDNQPPAIVNVSHSPSTPSTTDAVGVSASITDASGIASASLNYSTNGGATWNAAGMANTSGSIWVGSIPSQTQGTIFYTVQATDILGRTTVSGQFSYTTADRTAPDIFSWVRTPADVNEKSGGAISVSVIITDNGGSGIPPTAPGFDYSIGGAAYDGYEAMTSEGANTWSFIIPAQDWNNLRGQVLAYRVTAVDQAGNTAEEEQTDQIDSINDPPVISDATPVETRVTLNPGECMEFYITVSDGDGDALFFAWFLDGANVGNANSYNFCPIEDDVGFHLLSLRVSDGSMMDRQDWEPYVAGDVTYFIYLPLIRK